MSATPPAFADKLNQEYIAELRSRLDVARADARQRHGKVSGLETVALYSDNLRSLLRYHMEQVAERLGCQGMADNIALIAVGGFGRYELGLFSDIDFCFLTERPPTPEEEEFLKAALYPLWSLKLDLGYSVHSVREALAAIGNDLHKTTAFFETRPIWGNEGIWEELNDRLHARLRKNNLPWLLSSLEAETRARHEQHGDTVFLLEPDVKNSRGGLRDIHLMLWIAYGTLGVSELDALSENGIISASEQERLHRAWSHLIEVRNAIHLCENRRIDKLTLERQIRVAEAMGLTRSDNVLAEEHLMRQYYEHASIVERLSRRVLERSLRQTPGTPQNAAESEPARRIDRDFWARGHRLWVEQHDLAELDSDPHWPMRLFLAAAREGLELSDNTLRHVEERLGMIDDVYRSSAAARILFLDILRTTGNLANTLRAMNRCGFLSAYLPEFAGVRNLPRIDHYHQFTVDEHLIRSIAVAEALVSPRAPQGMEHVAHEARQVLRQDLLHLALLLHDTGKGEGRAHVITGMHYAQRVAERMHLRPVETEILRSVVANHQKMTHFVMRRNLEELGPAKELAEAVGNPELLRMLYVHSACDLAGVSAESWNDWRGRLLAMLYAQARDILRGVDVSAHHRLPDQQANEAVWDVLLKETTAGTNPPTRETLDRFLNDMPERYLSSVAPEDAARHFLLSARIDRETRVVHRIDVYPDSNYVEITFVANDAPGLFSLLCSGLASKKINILSAQIYTAFSGEAVDIFQVQVPPSIQSTVADEVSRLTDRLNKALRTGERPTWEKSLKAGPAAPLTRDRLEMRPPRVDINNDTSTTHTIIEVRAPDRPGLLSDITAVFDRLNINVDLAFIATESYQIVDSFYVTDLETNKIREEKVLENLRGELIKTIHARIEV